MVIGRATMQALVGKAGDTYLSLLFFRHSLREGVQGGLVSPCWLGGALVCPHKPSPFPSWPPPAAREEHLKSDLLFPFAL